MNRYLMSKFIIFASARTGSSSLAEVLGESKDVQLCFEPFNPKYAQWNPGEKNYSELIKNKDMMNFYIDELFSRFNALKVLDYQLPYDIYAELLKRKEIKILFLRRKNLLQMAVSAMVAHQTGEWRKAKNDSIYDNLQQLDIDQIKKRIDYIKELNDKYYNFLEKYRKDDFLPLWYEDLFSEEMDKNIKKLTRICEFVNISLPSEDAIREHMIPSTAKSNYKNIYKNIPNIEEIENHIGKI